MIDGRSDNEREYSKSLKNIRVDKNLEEKNLCKKIKDIKNYEI